MQSLRFVSLIALAFLPVVTTGCGSSTPYYGPSGEPNYFTISTMATSPSEPWPNAQITGWADPNTLTCDPATDFSCVAEIGSGTSPYAISQSAISAFDTDSSGLAEFGTDAYLATWDFYAQDTGSSQCAGGSASITIYDFLGGGQVPLTCGQNDASMISNPGSCRVEPGYTVGNVWIPPTDTCTASITLSFPSPISSSYVLPLNTPLVSADYSSAGDNLAQNSVEASTTASVVVPTPTTYGTTYLAVSNASGNVIGVAEFTRTYVAPPTNPCLTAASSATGKLAVSPDTPCIQ